LIFEPFFIGFNAASWPTFSSMSNEAALKPMKKYIKNQTILIQQRPLNNPKSLALEGYTQTTSKVGFGYIPLPPQTYPKGLN
jgi:hypothetical protein